MSWASPVRRTGATRERELALPGVRMPSESRRWRIVRHAARQAPPAVRHAIAGGMDDYELAIWWAAHAGAERLAEPMAVADAIAASLAIAPDDRAPSPGRLPPEERVVELIPLLGMLGRLRHRTTWRGRGLALIHISE